VRDLIEAGLSELDDAVVAMDLVLIGSMAVQQCSRAGPERLSDICHLDDDAERSFALAADRLWQPRCLSRRQATEIPVVPIDKAVATPCMILGEILVLMSCPAVPERDRLDHAATLPRSATSRRSMGMRWG